MKLTLQVDNGKIKTTLRIAENGGTVPPPTHPTPPPDFEIIPLTLLFVVPIAMGVAWKKFVEKSVMTPSPDVVSFVA